VATLNLEHGFQNNAWQKFLTTGPVALLPRADGLYALIWSAKESFAKELLSMSDSCFEKTLLNKVGADFGKMKLASNKYSFSLVSSYTKKLYNKRCIFLGDAARFIHPLFGQGANMGFLDVLAIKDIITRKDKNVGKVFHNTRYQDGITLGKAADIINENACWNNKLMAETRARLGLFIINAPCAKRFLINHALGKRFNQHTNYKCSWPEY
jgi:2-polyprenyl-6-methoxyphenol hydroxylase-like FAD-dependent oxidoreductase